MKVAKELKFNEILKGERVVLKLMNPTLENSKKLFNLIDRNRSHLEPWFSWVRETRELFDTIKFQINKTEIQYGVYNEEDVFMGSIAMIKLNTDKKRFGEIGYWIGKEFIGRGYMSEAVKILEKEFFDNFNLNRIVIRCNFRNKASESVARKNNYFFEGISRQDYFNENTGELEDSLNFSKLKSEYEKK